MKLGIDRDIAAIGVDSEGGRGASGRNGIANLAGNGDGPDPGQRVREIAEPFAEIQRRRVGVERVSTDAGRTRSTPFDTEADGHHKFVVRVLEHPVFEGRLQILEPVGAKTGGPARRTETRVGRADGNRERVGDPLGKFRGKIALPKRRIVACFER